jgi:type IV secretion system protein VirB10
MSGETPAGEGNPVAPAASPPPDLRLRAERPRVVRLSRTVVWSLGGVGMIAVAFALGYRKVGKRAWLQASIAIIRWSASMRC